MLAMYQRAPETPNGRAGIRQSSSPVRSSPLNPNYRLNNPPSQRRASLHNHLHTQSRYTRPVAPNHGLQNDLFSTEASEDPKKAVWREAFRRKCAERAQRDRVDYRVSKRIQAGSDRPEESDALGHVVDEDQDTEYGEGMEDELYSALMIAERRRQSHAYNVSFAYNVGSSLDPNMEVFDEIEQHFAGPSQARESSPPEGSWDDEMVLPDDYPIPSDGDGPEASSDYADMDMEMEMDLSTFSSPPTSPVKSRRSTVPVVPSTSFVGLLLASPCPHCHAPYSLHLDDDLDEPALMCAVCTNSFGLGTSAQSWDEAHPRFSRAHYPLAVVEPALSDGVVLLCSDSSCQWGFSL